MTDGPSFARAAGPFDLAVLDPPYAFDQWSTLLEHLDAAVVVIESDRSIDLVPSWRILKEKRYAGTVVTIAARSQPSASPGGDPADHIPQEGSSA